MQVHEAAGTTVNGYILPTKPGIHYAGDKAVLILNFSTPRVFGNEITDEDGKFKYDIYVTLRLDGQTVVKPKNFTQGVWILPLAVNVPIRIDLNHPLSVGKWIVDAQAFQELGGEMRPVDMNPNSWEIDVFQPPAPERSWIQLVTENSATIPGGVVVGVAVAFIIYIFKRGRPKKVPDRRERRDELQKITDRIDALPKDYMRNLRYHYCKLKNNGRPVDFSYHTPALKDQADTIEQTIESIAPIALEGAVDFREFKRLHGPFVLRAWVFCEEDIDIKERTYPETGSKFRQLANKIGKTMKLPKIECADVNEKMPPDDERT
jgi:hypothetical protein